MHGFVDCHTHMLPSGDDGVDSVDEAEALCRDAERRGTTMLFATPHVWPHLPLTSRREAEVRRAYAELRPRLGLELRLGWELTPTASLLQEDLSRYELEGAGAVLMEVPFLGEADLVFALAERAERQGLRPVIAHPERTEAVHRDRGIAIELARRGWPLQVNATSLTGKHGPDVEELAWTLVDDGLVALVASDGHREERPPFLDDACASARARLGDEALQLFDGSALGLGEAAASAAPPTSRGGWPGGEASRARSDARARG